MKNGLTSIDIGKQAHHKIWELTSNRKAKQRLRNSTLINVFNTLAHKVFHDYQ